MESYTSKYTGEQIDNSVAVGQQVSEELSLHVDNFSNPHKVTQAQVGLGNVNNTSDLDKPISTATQEALSQKASSSDVASVQATATNALTVANEAKSIAEGKTSSFVFDTVNAMNEWLANPSNTAQLSIGSNLYIRENGVPDYWWDGTTAIELESEGANLSDYYTSEQVDALLDTKASNLTVSNHINNQSNPHNVTQAQVGLGNVNNTSDLDKPISTATQTALDLKANQSALSQEISAREAADTSLNESISTETTNRQEADEALSQEITALTESLSDYVSVQPQSLSTAQQLQARTNIGAAPSSTIGIPSGGNSGQILAKTSDSNYAVSWEDPPIETPTAILYTPQVLTDEQKTQARENIGAGTGSGGGTTVVANPSTTATDTLTSLQVGNTVYSVGADSTIVVDLGDIGSISGSPTTLTITEAQGQALLSNASVIVKLYVNSSTYLYLSCINKTADGAQYSSYIVGEDTSPYIATYSLSIESTTPTQAQLTVEKINLSSSSTIVVDLGNIGDLSESPTTITITQEQCTQLLAADTSIVRFTAVDQIMNLLRIMKHGDGGGTAFYTANMVQGGSIESFTLAVGNSSPTQAQISWESAELGGTTVVANPTASATSTLSKLQVDNTVYSIPQGSSGPTDIITEEEYADMLSQGTVSPDTIYYIEGTSDNTLSVTAATTSYDNASSGLTATNVQGAIDEIVQANSALSGQVSSLQESKQDLLTLQSLATLLGLTEEQLNNLITFSKSITVATTGSATISGTITADTFNTNQ